MHLFLAWFSEPVWSGHLASWADFITTTPELEFSVHTEACAFLKGRSRLVSEYFPITQTFAICLNKPDIAWVHGKAGPLLYRRDGGG
jgi:hypothetical protein